MKGIYLKFFAYELQKHEDMLLYEWLIERSKKAKIPGVSVFRSIAGHGRHKKLHEEHFFELASNVPIEIVFALSEEQAEAFLSDLKKEKLDLFYIKIPIEYGSLLD